MWICIKVHSHILTLKIVKSVVQYFYIHTVLVFHARPLQIAVQVAFKTNSSTYVFPTKNVELCRRIYAATWKNKGETWSKVSPEIAKRNKFPLERWIVAKTIARSESKHSARFNEVGKRKETVACVTCYANDVRCLESGKSVIEFAELAVLHAPNWSILQRLDNDLRVWEQWFNRGLIGRVL